MAILLLIGIIAAFWYYYSLKIHPQIKCKWCNGTGWHSSTFYVDDERKCRKCGGSGRRDRIGTRIFLDRK